MHKVWPAVQANCDKKDRRTLQEIWSFSCNVQVSRLDFFALALDKTYDIRGTAQLLVLVRGWMDLRTSWQQCAQWKRRLPVHSFMEVHVCMAMLGVKWDSLVDVPTDSCPNLTGKSICNRKWLNSTQIRNWYLCSILYMCWASQCWKLTMLFVLYQNQSKSTSWGHERWIEDSFVAHLEENGTNIVTSTMLSDGPAC